MSNSLNKLGQREAEASQSAAGEPRSALGLATKWCTPTDLPHCDSAELISASCKEKCDF